jgi:hypothetical protein
MKKFENMTFDNIFGILYKVPTIKFLYGAANQVDKLATKIESYEAKVAFVLSQLETI